MPAQPSVSITVKIPPALYTWLRAQGNMTAAIIAALERMKEGQGQR